MEKTNKRHALSVVFQSFLETDSAQKTERSQKADKRFFEIVLHYLTDQKLEFVDEVELEHLQKFEIWLSKEQKFGSKTKEPWAQPSIALRLQTLKKLFRKLVATRKLEYNPFELFHMERGSSKRRRGMTLNEFDKLYQLAPEWGRSVLTFMRMTGSRGASIAALTWDDIDFEKEVLILKSRKGGIKRIKEIPFPLYPALKEFLLDHKKPKTVSHYSINPLVVFFGPTGIAVTAQEISTLGSRLIKQAGLSGVVLYGLRHAIAIELTAAGVPLEITRQAMGHSSLAQTSHYASGIASKSVADALAGIRKK